MSTVFVTGISSNTQAIDVEDEFSFYGEVLSCYIPQGKRICFVKYKNAVDAERSIDRMNLEEIHGCRINVSWARNRSRNNQTDGMKPKSRSRSR